MRKHRLGKQLLIVLCVVLIVFLAGCRPSPVLEQIIYEQNHQVDPDVETKTMNDDLENEEPDEDIPSRETVDDSEQEKDQEYTSALAGDEDTDSDPDAVYSVTYSPTGELSEPAETNPTADSTSDTATGTNEAGGDEGGNFASGEGSEPGNDGTSDGDSGGGTDAGTGQTGGGNGDGDNDLVSGEGTKTTNEEVPKKVVDDNNNSTPEQVVNGSRVTAVGEAATIVEMLGGYGQLVGTSSDYKENSFAQQAFASQGFSEIPVWWNGDGSSACNNFQALLDAHPDVCIEISGQDTFSDEQITALTDAGIAYQVIPQLNSIDNIKSAVTVVGQVLGGDAESMASNYCSWAENVMSLASGKYSKKATAYIGRWDYEAHWSIDSTGRGNLWSGEGAPVGMTYAGESPLSECMECAGIVNSASADYYVEPLYQIRWEPTITGGSARYKPYIHSLQNSTYGNLGTETYPAVIVADSTIRDNILTGDYYWYHWRAGETIHYDNTYIYGIYLNDDDGTFLSTYIQNTQPYKILVNPSGVGSWAKGSVESPLEALWLAYEFQGAVSKSEVENEVRNFYSTFYNYPNADTLAIMPEDWTYPG